MPHSMSITGTVSEHQRAAELACRRIPQTDDLAESLRCIASHCVRLFRVRQFKKNSLLAFEEPEFKPTKQIIHEGLGMADLRIAGPAAGLKSSVAELVAENL